MTESAPFPDEVTLGDPASPVGLCTLWTRQERILRGVPRELYAVCGNLYSLWGISLLVRGVLARPSLRYLVVCGVDYADTGRALVALVTAGLAPDGTLPGTEARLADDLDAAALARFRQQVSLVDLRGCTDAARVAAAIRALPGGPPPAPQFWGEPSSAPPAPQFWGEPGLAPPSFASPGGEMAASPPPSSLRAAPPDREEELAASPPPNSLRGPLPSTGEAPVVGEAGLPPGLGGGGGPSPPAVPGRFEPDPRGNFLIAVGDGQIVAAHATTTGGPTGARFAGRMAAEVYGAILAAALVSRLDHAAYLGAELARAEVALRLGLPYRQDRPLALPTR